jgi:ABC-type dipeptide/oligopeptide/nickel transport system permease subunit
MSKKILKNPQAIVGLLLISAMILAAVFAPVLAPHDPELVDTR